MEALWNLDKVRKWKIGNCADGWWNAPVSMHVIVDSGWLFWVRFGLVQCDPL